MRCPPPPGRKTAVKFDVEKIFQETRRTAREYSQQTSGGRRSIVPQQLSWSGRGHSLHSQFLKLLSRILCHQILYLLLSSVKQKLEGAEVGVEGGGSEGGGGGEGGDVDSDSSDSEVVGPPLPPGYKVRTNGG